MVTSSNYMLDANILEKKDGYNPMSYQFYSCSPNGEVAFGCKEGM